MQNSGAAAGLRLRMRRVYQGAAAVVTWEGCSVDSRAEFKRYLRDVVGPWTEDEKSLFAQDIQGLATTGMQTEFVESALGAAPEPKPWEIGEALAECVLRDACPNVCWPWNTVRDRRTPQASLPGADLVGLAGRDGQAVFLFGEVKASAEARVPPSVMTGPSGMKSQLDRIATRVDVKFALLKWLHSRCRTPELERLFDSATQRFLASKGRDVLLVGILVRDTDPNQADLQSAGLALSRRVAAPGQASLAAWYVPVRIRDWPATIREGAV